MKIILVTAMTLLSAMPVSATQKNTQSNPPSVSQNEKKTVRPLPHSTQEEEEDLAYKEEYRPESLRKETKETSEEEQKKKPIRGSRTMRDMQSYGREFHEHNHDNH